MTIHDEKSYLIPFRSPFAKLHGIYGSTHSASIIPFARSVCTGTWSMEILLHLKQYTSERNQDTSQQPLDFNETFIFF